MQYHMILAAFAVGATTVMAAPAPAASVELAARYHANQTNGQAAGVTDTDVFNLGLTLEHLESAFYQEGLQNFTAQDFQDAGLPAAFYNNLRIVASHELTHASFLEGVLGNQAVQPCKYQFPSTDPVSFLQFSAAIEAAGVSAYLGAAPFISSNTYLTEAGSILAVEARHTSYVRYARTLLDNPPVSPYPPFPSPFDIPLSPSESYTAASRYIVSCPSGNAEKLAFLTKFPLLNLVDQNATLTKGSVIELAPQVDDVAHYLNECNVKEIYAAFPTATGPIYAPVIQSDRGYTTVVPEGLNGQAYVVLNKGMDGVTDETVLFGPAVLQITNDPIDS